MGLKRSLSSRQHISKCVQALWSSVYDFIRRENSDKLRKLKTSTTSTLDHRFIFQDLGKFISLKGIEIIREELAWMEHVRYISKVESEEYQLKTWHVETTSKSYGQSSHLVKENGQTIFCDCETYYYSTFFVGIF
jgi:hypothetical protein